ncbi:hypothetical protein PH213_39875 [Streptomyces sp. SRF1]|uniref:hypothetical protein n=1 Tax=Streptomyces sp. SRF1 TaxID=1549642 RepID=UPI0025AF6F6E|nr:hypothetical protein [Streptomyces sp. SRF1]MDN3060566.1 hypothetical protein [Streptomyces sp. SRF1]
MAVQVEHGMGGGLAAGGEGVPLAAQPLGKSGGTQLHGGGDDGIGREVGSVAAGKNQKVPLGATATAGHDRERPVPLVAIVAGSFGVDDPAQRAVGPQGFARDRRPSDVMAGDVNAGASSRIRWPMASPMASALFRTEDGRVEGLRRRLGV